MHIKLMGVFGPAAGLEADVAAGKALRVGRSADHADLAIPEDGFLSRHHFTVECTIAECSVRNHSANGVTVKGTAVTEPVALSDGDLIVAGNSHFSVRFESAPLPSVLKQQALPIYAILDAAREQRIPQFLEQSGARYQSLYEGERGEALGSVAPYLVELGAAPAITDTLAAYGWGKSWGVFLVARIPFEEIRKHFRHFLMVNNEEGRRYIFRYYDPRILRVFLPTCTPQESARFFGPVERFLVESEDGQAALRFRVSPEGLQQEEIKLERAQA